MRASLGCIRLATVTLATVITGCGASAPPCPPCARAAAPEPVPAPAAPERSPAPAPDAPDGYVELRPAGVLPGRGGGTLVLTDPARTVMVPVSIGGSEAMVIDLRLRGERFERPLTHDLLSQMLTELGAEVVMVQVNKLRGNIFVGSVFVWDGHEMHRFDSRTSDAVAIAVGHQVPIYVAQIVIDETGVPADEAAP